MPITFVDKPKTSHQGWRALVLPERGEHMGFSMLDKKRACIDLYSHPNKQKCGNLQRKHKPLRCHTDQIDRSSSQVKLMNIQFPPSIEPLRGREEKQEPTKRKLCLTHAQQKCKEGAD
jgi:hypothetical protein